MGEGPTYLELGARFYSSLNSDVSPTGVGNGGDLTIETGTLSIRDGGNVSAATFNRGNGGNIQARASDLVEVVGATRDGLSSSLVTNVFLDGGEGNAGNVTVDTRFLSLRDGGQVTADARGTATGGNITLNTDVLAALENSDITANAQQGSGGRVIINAQGIFGTQFRNQLTPESDITASSNLGPQFSGIVEINIPDVDTSLGLATLPAELVEASWLIATGCAADEENKFIVTGRGGLPPNPGDTLRGEAVLADWITLDPEVENRSSTVPTTNPTIESVPTQIVEAQGWLINNKGEVVLTATAPNVTPNIPWMSPTTCH